MSVFKLRCTYYIPRAGCTHTAHCMLCCDVIASSQCYSFFGLCACLFLNRYKTQPKSAPPSTQLYAAIARDVLVHQVLVGAPCLAFVCSYLLPWRRQAWPVLVAGCSFKDVLFCFLVFFICEVCWGAISVYRTKVVCFCSQRECVPNGNGTRLAYLQHPLLLSTCFVSAWKNQSAL